MDKVKGKDYSGVYTELVPMSLRTFTKSLLFLSLFQKATGFVIMSILSAEKYMIDNLFNEKKMKGCLFSCNAHNRQVTVFSL